MNFSNFSLVFNILSDLVSLQFFKDHTQMEVFAENRIKKFQLEYDLQVWFDHNGMVGWLD